MRESKIEKHLVERVKAAGGLCWKFTSTNLRGVPDRVVMLPNRPTVWAELKAPGGRLSALQVRRHKDLWRVGQPVVVLASIEAVDTFMEAQT